MPASTRAREPARSLHYCHGRSSVYDEHITAAVRRGPACKAHNNVCHLFWQCELGAACCCSVLTRTDEGPASLGGEELTGSSFVPLV
jgi:hypothetical protein